MSQGHRSHLTIDIPRLPPHRVCGRDFFLLEFPWGPYNSPEHWLYCSGRHTLVRLVTLVLQATPSPRLLPLTPAVALVQKTHELVWAEVRNPELPGFADIWGESLDDSELLLPLCAAEQLTIKCLCHPFLLCKTWPRIFTWLELKGCCDFLKKMRYLGIPNSCKYMKSTWGKMILNNSLRYWRRRAWQPTPVFLAWRIQWTKIPGGLWPTRSQRVRRAWSNLAQHTWYWNKSKAKKKKTERRCIKCCCCCC